MIRVGNRTRNEYLKNDWILSLLLKDNNKDRDNLLCDQWLKNCSGKRVVYDLLYKDLFLKGNKKVLDVGGGITSLTNKLIDKNEYMLLDILSHGNNRDIDSLSSNCLIKEDWYYAAVKHSYDVVIANDLFPNVDQRLSLFIKKFLPISKEIRLSLTYYSPYAHP